MLIDLVLTVPGAHVGFGAQTGSTNPLYWRPGQRSAVVIGGARPNANFFLLDGATNTDPTFNTQNLSPSPDAVKEFQVETSSYTADMGGAGGGQINIVTHSGSSQFHGTAYEFLRNGAMDASTFGSMGNNHSGAEQFRRLLRRTAVQEKYILLCELRRIAALASRRANPYRAYTRRDPGRFQHEQHQDLRSDDGHCESRLTIRRSPQVQTIFPIRALSSPANIIPSDRINPLLEAFLMQYVPMPNMICPWPDGADSNNYLDIRNETHFQDQGTVRIDHNFANGDTLFGRYSIGDENGFSPSSGITATTENMPGFGANFDNRSQQAAISWNHIFAPNKVNTAPIAVSRLSMDRTSQNDNVNDIVSQLGIQGSRLRRTRMRGARRGSQRKATRASAIRLPRHRCTLGTRCMKSATPMRGNTAGTASNSAAIFIGTRGRCGDFSRIAATTSTRTATPPNLASTMEAVHGFASLLLSLPAVKAAPGRHPSNESAQLGHGRLRRRQLESDFHPYAQPGSALRIHQPALRQKQYEHQSNLQ